MWFGMEMLLVKPHVQDQSNKEQVNIASNWGFGEGKALKYMQCLWFEKVRLIIAKKARKVNKMATRIAMEYWNLLLFILKRKNWMQEFTQRLREWFLVWSEAVFGRLKVWKILDFKRFKGLCLGAMASTFDQKRHVVGSSLGINFWTIGDKADYQSLLANLTKIGVSSIEYELF